MSRYTKTIKPVEVVTHNYDEKIKAREMFVGALIKDLNNPHTITLWERPTTGGECAEHHVSINFYNRDCNSTSETSSLLGRFDMHDWRKIWNDIIYGILGEGHTRDIPNVRVTLATSNDETDIIRECQLDYTTNKEVYDALERSLKLLEFGYEVCAQCGHEIEYKRKPGAILVVCDECGEVNALCNDCEKQFGCTEKCCDALALKAKIINTRVSK